MHTSNTFQFFLLQVNFADMFKEFYHWLLLMFVKAHALHKLKIRGYTKLVSNLVDASLFLRCLSSKKPKNTSR